MSYVFGYQAEARAKRPQSLRETRQERGRESIQIEALIPIRIQRPLADGGGLGLLAIDGRNGKRIGKSCND